METKLKTNEPKFVTRAEAAEMLGVDRQTIANLIARGILQHGGHIVSKSGKNATSVVCTKELFDMINKMGDLVNVDQSLKNIELLKVELADKEKEYKEYIESLEEKIDCGNVNYILDMFRGNFNDMLSKMLDRLTGISFFNRDVFRDFANGTRVETIARWHNTTIPRIWQSVAKVAKALSVMAEDYNSVVDERDNYKCLIEKQAEEIRALRAMVTNSNRNVEPVVDNKIKETVAMQNKLNVSISDVNDLSIRALNILTLAGIKTLGDLARIKKHQLLQYRNLGKKTLIEIEETLEKHGLQFGMDLSQYNIA